MRVRWSGIALYWRQVLRAKSERERGEGSRGRTHAIPPRPMQCPVSALGSKERIDFLIRSTRSVESSARSFIMSSGHAAPAHRRGYVEVG